jgi:hypothetical protein
MEAGVLWVYWVKLFLGFSDFFRYIYYRNSYYEFPLPVTGLFFFQAEKEEPNARGSVPQIVSAGGRLGHGVTGRQGFGPPEEGSSGSSDRGFPLFR